MKPDFSQPFVRALSAGGIFLLSLTAMTTLAEAQMAPDRTEIKQVAGQLHLNTVQQQAFLRIVDEFQMSVETTLERYGVDPFEARPPPTVRFALRSDVQESVSLMDKQLAVILTADQLREFKQIRRERIRMR